MNNPLGNFGSDESGFEQNAVQKAAGQAVKAVSAQVAQQSKQVTQDIVSQLFGADYTQSPSGGSGASGVEQGVSSPKQAQKHPAQPPQQPQSSTSPQPEAAPDPLSQFPGLQTAPEKSQYEEAQKKLIEEKNKAQVQRKLHTQNYYEPEFGFETKLKQAEVQRKRENEAEKKQEEQKKEQEKLELEEKKKQDVPRAIQNGRFRTERNPGASG